MCYAVYHSTNSPKNLTKYNSDLLRFKRLESGEDRFVGLLQHQEKWFVGSKTGCSCTFRHLASTKLGFGEPVDWYPEDEDSIKATGELYQVIIRLTAHGHNLDLLDVWEEEGLEKINAKTVDLEKIPEKSFRLFENYHFIFV